MSAFGNDITITLTLDDGQLTMTAKRAGEVLNKLVSDVRRQAESTKALEQRLTGLGQSFRDLVQVGGMLRFVMYDIRDVFQATFGAVVKSSGEIERMTKLMEGLSRATSEQARLQEALASKQFIFDMAKTAPFEVKALTDAFIKLKSAGLDPMDGKLKTLVDSVAKFGGSSETLHRASIAIQQMAGKGVISMEELRQQLGEAVPTAMRNMADGMGMTMGELVKHISRGEVAAKPALDRMFAVMKAENDGAAAAMMATWVGQFEKLKTNLTLFANDIGKSGFFEEIKKQLESLNQWFESDEGAAFAKRIGYAFADVAESLGKLAVFVHENIGAIKLFGEALILVWGGTKAVAAYTAITEMWKKLGLLVKGHYASTIGAAITSAKVEEQIRQQALIREAQAANQAVFAQQAANTRELQNSQAKYAAQMVQMEQYYSLRKGLLIDAEVAEQAWAKRKMAGVSQEAVLMRQQAQTFWERAMAAEKSAAAIVIAEEKIRAEMAATMVAMRGQAAAAQASLAGVGAAATASVARMGALKGALMFLGGPIGIITTLLTIGGIAWMTWGNKASEAANKAADALRSVKSGFADYEQATQITEQIKTLKTEIEKGEAALEAYKKAPVAARGGGYKAKQNGIRERELALAELRKDLAAHQAQEADAYRYASENSVANAARVNNSRVEAILSAQKLAIKIQSDGYIQNLTEQLAANKITQERFDALEQAEMRSRAQKFAKAEEAAWQQNANNSAAKLRGAKPGSDAAKGYAEQLTHANDMVRQAQDAYEAASRIGTKFTDFIATTAEKDAAAVKNGSESWFTKISGEISVMAAKYRGVTITANQVGEFRAEAEASLRAALNNGDFDVTTGTGKNKTTTRPGSVLPEYIDIEAFRLALEKYGSEYKNEIEGAIKDMNALDDKLRERNTASASGQASAWETLTQPIAAPIPTSVVQFREWLEKEIANIEMLFKLGIVEKEEFDRQMASNRALATGVEANMYAEDALKYVASLKKKRAALEESLMTEREAKQAHYDREVKEMERLANVEALTGAQRLAAEQELKATLEVMARAHARAMETPMQKMLRDWQDTTGEMQQATASWLDGAVDALVEFVKTGELNFSNLMDQILTDMLRMQLRKQVADMFGGVQDILGAGKSAVATSTGVGGSDVLAGAVDPATGAVKVVNVASATGAPASATDPAVTAQLSFFDKVKKMVSDLWTSAKGVFDQIWTKLGSVFEFFKTGLTTAIGWLQEGFGSLMKNMPSMSGIGGMLESGWDWITSFFADGGIMTDMGPVSLRKYANGGIANTPQLAMYGEGSMPEAYVPLPDGRSIPVTMKGTVGGGGGTVVNVNVHEAPGTKAEVHQSQGQDGSTQIDVIIQQVEGKISQNISKGKGAMAGVIERTYGLNRVAGAY